MLGIERLAAVVCAVALICGATNGFAQTGELVDRDMLRVCADPHNLPFSNEAGEGFENKIAELLAGDLGLEIAYTWYPQVDRLRAQHSRRTRLRRRHGIGQRRRADAEHQSVLPLELRPGPARRCQDQGGTR